MRLDIPVEPLRLDVVDGITANEPVVIEPFVDWLRDVEAQLSTIRRLGALLRGELASEPGNRRQARRIEALRAIDARAAGASLRDIGLGIVGDDWPGDGEYVKSRARRLIVEATKLAAAGPHGVLADGSRLLFRPREQAPKRQP